jgi:hypothetical protein
MNLRILPTSHRPLFFENAIFESLDGDRGALHHKGCLDDVDERAQNITP